MDAETRARLGAWVDHPDLRALLAAYDAQAARLAAVEQALATAQLRIGELFDLRGAAEQERDALAAGDGRDDA